MLITIKFSNKIPMSHDTFWSINLVLIIIYTWRMLFSHFSKLNRLLLPSYMLLFHLKTVVLLWFNTPVNSCSWNCYHWVPNSWMWFSLHFLLMPIFQLKQKLRNPRNTIFFLCCHLKYDDIVSFLIYHNMFDSMMQFKTTNYRRIEYNKY